jgi:hypothetical protein
VAAKYITHHQPKEAHHGEFHWSNAKARAAIRHNLTSYEELWGLINRGRTGDPAYEILRPRVDALVGEAYPKYAEGKPQVPYKWA